MFKMNVNQIVYVDKYTMYKHTKASPLNLTNTYTHTHIQLCTIHENRKHHIAFHRDK